MNQQERKCVERALQAKKTNPDAAARMLTFLHRAAPTEKKQKEIEQAMKDNGLFHLCHDVNGSLVVK